MTRTEQPHAEPGDSAGGGPDALSEASRRREAVVASAFGRVAAASARFLLVVLGVVVLGYLAGKLWVVLLPVLLGLLLATVLWPAVRWLRRRGVPAALAALGVLLVALMLLLGVVGGLAPQVTGQAQELGDQVAAGLGELQKGLTGPPFNLGEEQIGQTVDNVIGELQANARNIATRVLSGAAAAGSALLTALLAIVMCFFYLKDGPKFLPWLGGLVGPRAAPHVTEIAQRSWATLSGFIRAQAAVGLVDAVFIGIGLAVLGVPLALPLAVLVFFGAFIPIIGAVVSGALAALVALVTSGPTSALIVVGLVLVVQQLEGNVLQPILVGRTLDLHPAVVILSVTAGGTLAGITGAFLAVPVVAVLAVAIRYGRQQLAAVEPTPESPPAAAGQPDRHAGADTPAGTPRPDAAPARRHSESRAFPWSAVLAYVAHRRGTRPRPFRKGHHVTRPGTENHGTPSDPENKEQQAKKASGKADVAHKPGAVEASGATSTEHTDTGTKARSVGDGTADEDAEQAAVPGRNPESKFNRPG